MKINMPLNKYQWNRQSESYQIMAHVMKMKYIQPYHLYMYAMTIYSLQSIKQWKHLNILNINMAQPQPSERNKYMANKYNVITNIANNINVIIKIYQQTMAAIMQSM